MTTTPAHRRSPGTWLLATAILLLAVALPFFQEAWTLERVIVLLGAELALACLLAWLADSKRYPGALRVLCFLIFLAYAKHLVDELGGDRSAREAVFGFVLLGMPALAFAAFGGFVPAWATLEPAAVVEAPPVDVPESRDGETTLTEATQGVDVPSEAQSRN